MLREAVTTQGYAVGNLMPMAGKQKAAAQTATKGARRNYIQQWREARDLTQEELGAIIGRSKATVSRVETGEIGYSQPFLEAAAQALGTHPGMLLLRPPTDADALPATKPKKG